MITAPTLHLGAPTQAGPLTVHPIWTDAPAVARTPSTSIPRGASISELSTGAIVERLAVRNPTSRDFLLTGGSMFDGGEQHRVLVNSMLIEAGDEVDLDVRCVEQGRWGAHGTERRHGLHRCRAPLAVRGALRGIRIDDPLTARQRFGDDDRADRADEQVDVWSRVKRYERTLGDSATSSIVEVTDRLELEEREVLDRLQVLPGQRGVLIGIGGHPVTMEVFEHQRVLTAQFAAIIGGVLADARLVPAQPTPGHRARTFVGQVSARRLEPWAVAGSALAVEVRDDLVVADGLVIESNRMIHLSVLNARHELVGAR